MGKLNLKLMQGIEREELQIQKEMQVSDTYPDKPMGKMEETQEKSGDRETSSDSSRKVPTSAKPTKGKKDAKNKKTKAANGQKQVFSFRARLDDISVWKMYAVAAGTPMEEIGSQAMKEYINRHKLSGAELAVFEALMAREKQ